MQLSSFDDFLKGLHDEIVRLEFSHYDFKNQVRSLPKVLLLRMGLAKCVFSSSCTRMAVATTFLQRPGALSMEAFGNLTSHSFFPVVPGVCRMSSVFCKPCVLLVLLASR